MEDIGLIRWLFFEKKHLVYTAFGDDMYYKAAGQLSAHGVAYDAVLKVNANATPPLFNNAASSAQYNFYVAKEQEHRAQQALHG